MVAYFPDDASAAAARGALGLAADIAAVPDVDWVRKSLEGLAPVAAGRFYLHGSHDRERRRGGGQSLEIDAGTAFGTGHHGTTAGCLLALDHILKRQAPQRIFDLGCGTGVLAIAAAQATRRPVLATDIDPVATRVAATNARINGAAPLVRTTTARGLDHPVFAHRGPFDLIVANILARPLMRLAPAMGRIVAPGGTLVLSGILASQRRQVIAAYASQDFRHVRTIWRGGWVTLLLRR